MSEQRTVLLRQLMSLDGLIGPIEEIKTEFTPLIRHALSPKLVAECSELAMVADSKDKPSVRSYQMVKQVPCILFIYKENYRS